MLILHVVVYRAGLRCHVEGMSRHSCVRKVVALHPYSFDTMHVHYACATYTPMSKRGQQDHGDAAHSYGTLLGVLFLPTGSLICKSKHSKASPFPRGGGGFSSGKVAVLWTKREELFTGEAASSAAELSRDSQCQCLLS